MVLEMPVSQKVFSLNGFIDQRTRTTSRGTKDRFSVTIKSEPLIVNLDPVLLGQEPSLAMAKLLKNKIRDIGAPASPATIKRRISALRSASPGRRYTGGRLGAMNPGQTSRLFNDSGRLAVGIFARANRKESSWTINVPANRFDPSTFNGGLPAILLMIERLAFYVPELKNPKLMLDDAEFRAAVKRSLKKVHAKKLPMGTPAERVSSEIARQSSSNLSQMAQWAEGLLATLTGR
jgi:hypothetical protein